MTKGIYEKPVANTLMVKVESFPTKIKNKTKMPTFLSVSQHYIESSS